MIYLMNARNTHFYKIGITNNTKKRIRSLQTGCPHQIDLIATSKSSNAYEKYLHDKYKEYRVSGEWFAFMYDYVKSVVLLDIGTLCKDPIRSKDECASVIYECAINGVLKDTRRGMSAIDAVTMHFGETFKKNIGLNYYTNVK